MKYKSWMFLALTSLLVMSSLLIISSFRFQNDPWVAPKEADEISNPLKGNSDAVVEGKKLYTSMCVICHGNKGKGDGMAGINLKPRPTNLTTAGVQDQSDGAIYWKMREGRAPMASYKEVLKDEQRWQLVNYIRTLKGKK